VINISNSASKDNTLWPAGWPGRIAAGTGAPPRTAAGHRARDGRDAARADDILGLAARGLVLAGQALLSWLAAIPGRLGGRLFATNDDEARWHGWVITKTRGGLARSYRDPRFDALAGCPACRGSGAVAELACTPCLGTGRLTGGEAG
jgi:hypothetical protein